MTPAPDNTKMPSTPEEDSARWAQAHRQRRALVVVDVVESVRLMQAREDDFIDRWRRFVNEVRADVLPALGGQMVKSLGDGMLLAFDEVAQAMTAAREMHARLRRHNADVPEDATLYLRAGVHVADIVVDEIDLFGAGVNLTQRLTTLAGPGETVASLAAVDAIVVGLDAEVEDLGDCFLKHLAEPVRAFRVDAAASTPGRLAFRVDGPAAAELLTVAVLPLQNRVHPEAATDPVGHLLADDLIASMSGSPMLQVVSRLSSAALVGRAMALTDIGRLLKVDYLVHGSFAVSAGRMRVQCQLVEVGSAQVVHSLSVEGAEQDLLFGQADALADLAAELQRSMIRAEVRRACVAPMSTLKSYSILLGALSCMHSLSAHDFDRARAMLEYLVERHPRQGSARAWLGLWHVLRVGQGWSQDPAADAAAARSLVQVALDHDPGHALCLAINGLVSAYVHNDLPSAEQNYRAAIDANPNESLAWLYLSATHAYREDGGQAVECALKAQRLSPLDPLRYYYDNFTSTAMLAAGDHAGAIEYGERSLRRNAMHGPTLRTLAIAQALGGDLAQGPPDHRPDSPA